MKYIMFKVSTGTIERLVPMIFPNECVHAIMAVSFAHACEQHGWKVEGVASAGDVNITAEDCSGRSTTLNVDAQSEDAKVITTYDYLHGM